MKDRKAYNAEYRERNRQRLRDYQKRWRDQNPDKVRAKAKKLSEKDPDYWRKAKLKSRFQISLTEYNQKLIDQNETCAICKKKSDTTLAVDHDHTTKKVRGLLCLNCNTAIGSFKDDIVILQNAVEYLKKYQC